MPAPVAPGTCTWRLGCFSKLVAGTAAPPLAKHQLPPHHAHTSWGSPRQSAAVSMAIKTKGVGCRPCAPRRRRRQLHCVVCGSASSCALQLRGEGGGRHKRHAHAHAQARGVSAGGARFEVGVILQLIAARLHASASVRWQIKLQLQKRGSFWPSRISFLTSRIRSAGRVKMHGGGMTMGGRLTPRGMLACNP